MLKMFTAAAQGYAGNAISILNLGVWYLSVTWNPHHFANVRPTTIDRFASFVNEIIHRHNSIN